jgi:mono/diheme cytochrome c family protein
LNHSSKTSITHFLAISLYSTFLSSCYMSPSQLNVAEEELNPQEKSEVLYSRVQSEIIASVSCQGCHEPDGRSVDLTNENNILALIDRTNPLESKILTELRAFGGTMPPRSRAPLSQAQVDLVKDWVFSVAGKTPPPTTTTTTQPLPPTPPEITPSPSTTTTTTTTTLPTPAPVSPSPEVTFASVRKVFADARCLICHDSTKDINLSTRESILNGDISGLPLIDVGNAVNSLLYESIIDKKPANMPPRRSVANGLARYLTASEVEIVKQWIDQGAQ